MNLHIDSDASYLSEPKGRSRAAGYFYLSSKPTNPNKAPHPDTPPVPMNGAISVCSSILKEVLSSAAKAKLAALFHNGKEACPMRIALDELGHLQPPTPIVTNNSTAVGIANDNVKQKRSKALDMRFYWIHDQVRQNQFIVYWRRGKTNRADYFTKHHPATYHRRIRPKYLHLDKPNTNYFECLQDCDTSSSDACGEGMLMPGESGPRSDTTGFPSSESTTVGHSS